MKTIGMRLVYVLVIAFALAACDRKPVQNTQIVTSTIEPTETPQPTSIDAPTNTPEPSKVSFTTEDGTRLSGTLFGSGSIAVILAHQGGTGADQTTWQPFAKLLAEHGFTALTFDFRGIGQSEGELNLYRLIYDIEAAIDFMQNLGYDKIACVGASMGGTACLRAALDHNLIGLVFFASVKSLGPPSDDALTSVEFDELSQLTIPKLFMTASDDRFRNMGVVSDTTKLYEFSPEPKELHIFEGKTEHGTELFDTDDGDELTNLLLEFLIGLLE